MNFFKRFFSKKSNKPAEPTKPIFANRRWGVITAYYLETLEPLPGGMVAPRLGMMVFTDDEKVPRTGSASDLEILVHETGRELRWLNEYAFYTISRGMIPPQEDADRCQHLVCSNLNAAIRMAQNPPR